MINQNKTEVSPHYGGIKGGYTTTADNFADFLTSKAILLLVFMGFMGYRYYEVQQVFHAVLSASWPSHVIAVVAIFTTLIFMVNANDLAPFQLPSPSGEGPGVRLHWSKLVLVIYAFAINYFFWKPYEGKDIYDTGFRWFCCVMLSSMDYGFAHLFKEKQNRTSKEKTIKELDEQITDKTERLESLDQELIDYRKEVYELKKLIKAHTCPHCRETFPSPRSVRAHKTNCKQKTPKS